MIGLSNLFTIFIFLCVRLFVCVKASVILTKFFVLIFKFFSFRDFFFDHQFFFSFECMTRFWINFLILESRITALLLNCIQRKEEDP